MEEEVANQILNELINSKVTFTISPDVGGYEAIKTLLKTNKDLHESVDQIFEDYQDAGKRMFQYSETLDKIKEFLNQEIEYDKKKIKSELTRICLDEVVRQLKIYRNQILEIIKEGEKNATN
jgi:hypothetical protein